jgi:hypothetical protein
MFLNKVQDKLKIKIEDRLEDVLRIMKQNLEKVRKTQALNEDKL